MGLTLRTQDYCGVAGPEWLSARDAARTVCVTPEQCPGARRVVAPATIRIPAALQQGKSNPLPGGRWCSQGAAAPLLSPGRCVLLV